MCPSMQRTGENWKLRMAIWAIFRQLEAMLARAVCNAIIARLICLILQSIPSLRCQVLWVYFAYADGQSTFSLSHENGFNFVTNWALLRITDNAPIIGLLQLPRLMPNGSVKLDFNSPFPSSNATKLTENLKGLLVVCGTNASDNCNFTRGFMGLAF